MKKKCHYCESSNLVRVSRKPWMHWLPSSKLYRCTDCQGEFITIMNMIKIGLHSGYARLLMFNKTHMSSM